MTDKFRGIFFVVLVLTLACSLLAEQANAQTSNHELRTWTSSDGKFSVDASFISFADGNATLQKSDGDEIVVPVKRLSLVDHKYISSRSNWGRVWQSTSSDNEFFVARLDSIEGTQVNLTTITGEEMSVELSSLDPDSRKYALQQSGENQIGELSRESAPGASTTVVLPRGTTASDAAIRRLIADCEMKSRKIKIDGRANDWKDIPTFFDGTRIDKGRLDIERVGIAPRESDLIVMIETRQRPAREDFSFFVRVDFLGQGGKDIQFGLSSSLPQRLKVHDEADQFKVLAEVDLDGPVVKIGSVIEILIPYAELKSVLPTNMGEVLVGDKARPFIRVETFSFDRASRSIADYGPSAASFRFLKNEYPLDAEAPGDVRNSLPVSVPFEGKWFIGNAAMGYAGHVGIHAYDFMIMDRQLQRASVRGSKDNNDYYSFGRPILNPVDTVVTRMESIQPDGTPLEKVVKRSNKVVGSIRGSGGHEMLLYHFQQGGIDVKEGQNWKKGAVVGLCGNSGTSRAAHLHMEMRTPTVQGKSETLPITFEQAIVSLNPIPDDPWARHVENWEIRGNVFVESPQTPNEK